MKRFLVATGLILLAATQGLFAQCAGAESYTFTPTPGSSCIPGTVYTICYTMDGFNDLGTNWIDGFEINLGGAWEPGSLAGVSAPANCDGGGGEWIWVNSVTGTSSGATHGAGYYFDNTIDGNPGNDFGDWDALDACSWTMCFQVTVGNTPGASLSVGVTPLSDGEVGSWTSSACNGTSFPAFSCIIDEPCGTLDAIVDQDETCAGDADGSATATMTGGAAPITYSWNTTPIQNSTNATGLAAGTYTVTATDANQCVLQETITINAGGNSDATINNINANNELCENDAAVQVTTVEAGGTFTGTGISATGLFDPSTANIGINTITYTIPGVCPSVENMDILVIANDDATINDINNGNNICIGGGSVQLTTVQTGGTWSGTGVNATGLFDPAVSGLGTHIITYTFTGNCGDVETIDITVNDLDYTTTTTPSFCTADNGTATVNIATGTAPYTYLWSDGQTTQTASGLAGGNYTVDVTDASGCTLTQPSVVALDQGNLTSSISSFTDASCNGVCDGTATATGVSGTPPYLYVWDDPTNQTTPQAIDLCAGIYNVGITDANGCLATAQVTIAEPAVLSVTTVMDNESNCGLPDGEATATPIGGTVAGGYLYSWNSTPVQTTATATGLVAGTYTVTVTDDNNCEANTNVQITQTAGFTASISAFTDASCFGVCDGTATVTTSAGFTNPLSYSWDSTPVQSAQNATGLCSGIYNVVVTDGVGCNATASVTIGEPVKVSSTLSANSTQICIGQSVNLSATTTGGSPPYSNYNWTASPADATLLSNQQNPTVSPVVTTTYSFQSEDAGGCLSAAEDIVITVLPNLSIDVVRPSFFPDTAICPYDFAEINLKGIGGDGNYTFYQTSDLNNPIQLPIQVQPTSTTTYDFVVQDGCGTPQAFSSHTITVHELPDVAFTGDDLDGCHEHTTNFTDLTSPTPIAWEWNFSDPNSGANSSTLADATHQFSAAGLYDITLSVTTVEGCVADTTLPNYVEVYPLPYANFVATPERTNLLQGTIDFTDQSVGNIVDWNWNFGDGEESTEQNVEHAYFETGEFSIRLLVTTDQGCTDQYTSRVIIDPDFMFYVPNSFTPNDDGKNDYFRGYGEGIKWDTYELLVYNRWGEEIFYTNNVDNSWDGTFKGKQVPAEVYVWKIVLFDQTGEKRTYRGRVTLLR